MNERLSGVMLGVLAGLALAVATPAAGGEVYRCDFGAAELAAWRLPPQAGPMREDGRDFVRFVVPEAEKDGQRLMTRAFDIAAHRGQYLRVRCLVRAQGVSRPPADYNGVKVMLSYKTPTPVWRNVSHAWGDFDWRELSFAFHVADSADGGTLHLGLQDSFGTVDFAELRIEALPMTQVYPPVADLPEDFRAPYSARIKELPRLRGAMSPDVYRLGDLDALAAWKANLLRWQFTRNWGETGTERDLAEYNLWIDAKLDEFELVLADCERLGIKVALDLHTPPGGLDKDRDMAMFHEAGYAQAFVEVWRKIARRLKGRTGAIFGYNLVNEPMQRRPSSTDYLKTQYEAALAIREIDPDVPVIVESNIAAAPDTFAYLAPLPLKDVIYQVHMYQPMLYTHQGIQSKTPYAYPGEVGGAYYDKEALRRVLEPVRRFQSRHGARIYVGEFAATRWAEGAERYYADCVDLFEEYGWDWSYHAFRESKTWDVEYEGGDHKGGWVEAKTPTKRLEVLLDGFLKNKDQSAKGNF